MRCGALHESTDCDYQKWKCFNCNQIGHKSFDCRKKAGSSYVKMTKWDKQNEDNIRKYVPVQILGRNINLQLDSGSDLTIINLQMWKRLGRPTMPKTTKIVRSITGKIIVNAPPPKKRIFV